MSKQTKRRRVDEDPAAPQQCLHDIIVFGNICAKCGTSVEIPQNTTGTTRLTLNGGKNILLTQRGAREDAMRNVSALMGRRKLALVLDLDHTLLHATPDPRVAERGWDLASPDIHKIELREARHRPPACHYVKLRTGVRKLLKECHECYQLYIYTHGTRQYAEAIAKVIDPSSIYFQGRIISRSDNPDGMQHKELSQMFPCDATMALILDDRMDVWPSDLHNLIKVKPYHYFRNMADVNNAAGTSITSDAAVPTAQEPTTTEAAATAAATTTMAAAAAAPPAIPLPVEHDDELTHVLRVLLNVHATFYQQLNGGTGASASSSSSHGTGKRRRDEEDTAVDPSTLNAMVTNQVDGRGPSVQKILRQIRESVFSGVHMVFSGIIQKNTGMPAHEHPTWKQAELFGASVSNVVKKGVTHVVAKEPGTDKTMTATKLGIYNCSRLWLERSISTFQRCNERDYSFTPLEKLRQSQGFPPAGSGVFLPSVKRVPPPVKIHPRGQGTFVHRAGGDGAEDVGLSMAAWREENSRMLVEKKTEDDYDYDDDDDDDGCIIDSLMSNYL